MRLFLTILLMSYFSANATVYYVDNAGSDGNNGTSIGTAWKTIAKVNSFSFSPSDQVLFKAGGIWIESLKPIVSGSVGNEIIFGAYGTGAKPLITGLQTITGFTNASNIWSASVPNSVSKLNTVLVDNQIRAKGRFPNTGYLTYTSSASKYQITGSLTGTPDYTGAEAVVRTVHWIVDVSKISSQVGGVLNLRDSLTYVGTANNGYFIQNINSVLDVAGEWAYDSTAKVLSVYSVASPSVQISTIDTLVWLSQRSYLKFDGLAFTGANKAAFQIDTSDHITIQNCSINNSGYIGVSATKSPFVSLIGDSIQNSFSGAIYMREVYPFTPTINTCDNAFVNGCYIKNSGNIAGMGYNNNGRYNGIFIVGLNTTVTNNRVDSSGYNGIQFNGQNSVIRGNYVTNSTFVKDDGGGIYVVIGAYFPANYNDGSKIVSNIVINGIGASAGTSTSSYAAGIYIDDFCKNLQVDSNTISQGVGAGIFIHSSDSSAYRYNTILNSVGYGIQPLGTNVNITNGNIITRNIFYSGSVSQFNYARSGGSTLGTLDSNYYSRPSNENGNISNNGTVTNVAGLYQATGKEKNAQGTPVGITGSAPILLFNPLNTDSTFYISGTYISFNNSRFSNNVIVPAHGSVVLFKSLTNDIINPTRQVARNSRFKKFVTL